MRKPPRDEPTRPTDEGILLPHTEVYPHIEIPSNATIHILFGRHHTAADIGDIDRFTALVRGSDIVIPEVAGWEESGQKLYNRVAKGDYDARQRLIAAFEGLARQGMPGAEFEIEVVKALYSSGAQIAYVDLPKSHPDATLDPYKFIGKFPIIGSFEEGITRLDSNMRKGAKHQRSREITIIKTLGELLPKAISKHPKLKDKPDAKVLMWLGKIHTPVFDALHRDHGAQVSSEFYKEPQPDNIRELVLDYATGEIDSLPQEERRLAQGRVLAEVAASTAFRGLGIDPSRYTQDEVSARTARVIKPLSLEQLAELYNAIANNQRDNMTALGFQTSLIREFAR